jgi:all-trans-retinol 13,14-reductase
MTEGVRTPRPWSKRVPDDRGGPYDAIVIGSGIGGMTTAALLAHLGQRVLVLEQHYVPGGYTHAFRRNGYSWDVGVHLVGEVSPRALPGKVLGALTRGALTWEPIGATYDAFSFPDGFSIAFPDQPGAFAETLKAAFPHESDAIDAYMAETRATVKSMRGWYLQQALPPRLGAMLGAVVSRGARAAQQATVAEVTGRLFRDPRLRAVVNAQWGYHGSPPSEGSWALQALVVRHFQHGAYYPVGGSQRIAPALLQPVADAGGWTRICADVDQILVEDGRAVGVRMADGEEIRAARVVSAAGAWTTATRLLPPALRDDTWARAVAQHPPSAAHVALYLGFRGDIAAHGATRYSQWTYQTWDHERALWDVSPDAPVGTPPVLFTSFPSLKDPAHDPGPEQRHTAEIVTFVPWDAFQRWHGTPWRKRGADYEAFKQRMTDAMLEVIFAQHPGLRPLLDHAELSTPLSTELFARPYRGSIYGLAGTPERYADRWLRPRSPVPGLFLSGSDVASCGVVGAMVGGLLCGLSMEPWRGVRWLRQHLA